MIRNPLAIQRQRQMKAEIQRRVDGGEIDVAEGRRLLSAATSELIRRVQQRAKKPTD